MIFHPLHIPPQPRKLFNNPFGYEPDALCLEAVRKLQAKLLPSPSEGKMYGVLVVEREGELGYLQAYSGQIDWVDAGLPAEVDEDFVPPVFDYLQPDGYFKTHEAEITAINRQIASIEQGDEYREALDELERVRRETEQTVTRKRDAMIAAKFLRDQRRKEVFLSENEQREMIRQSQHLKAEWHRAKVSARQDIEEAEKAVEVIRQQAETLKRRRKMMSDHLQQWLFSQFVLYNARGEKRDLVEIWNRFAAESQMTKTGGIPPLAASSATGGIGRLANAVTLPPSGTGECCEPKLLQYAYRNGFRPVSMAMFWWGPSPKNEIRRHRRFYPACNGKCKPILDWMLRGLEVAPPTVEPVDGLPLDIIYEDDKLAVVVKPSGMLSVPGRSDRESVFSRMKEHWHDSDGPLVVHRLDMATSGLMVVARTKWVHQQLQAQFAARTVVKRYVALIEPGHLRPSVPESGIISLPMRPDPMDRPRQVVDAASGKPATTEYRIVGRTATNDSRFAEGVKVVLHPITGRTHQLRVHCAHPDGLNSPIIGDTLYGSKADRLYLHAEYLEFTHPASHRRMSFERQLW